METNIVISYSLYRCEDNKTFIIEQKKYILF